MSGDSKNSREGKLASKQRYTPEELSEMFNLPERRSLLAKIEVVDIPRSDSGKVEPTFRFVIQVPVKALVVIAGLLGSSGTIKLLVDALT